MKYVALFLSPIVLLCIRLIWSAKYVLKPQHEVDQTTSSECEEPVSSAPESVQSTPPERSLSVPNNTFSFNHRQEFTIHDTHIFYRTLGTKEWTLLPFDGFPRTKPVSLSVDGANLVVLDNAGMAEFHYKKVLEEKIENGEYTSHDIALSSPWIPVEM